LKKRSKRGKTKHAMIFPFVVSSLHAVGQYYGAWARGKMGGLYRYYRCTRKNGPCREGYLQEKHVAAQVQARLAPLAIHRRAAEIQILISQIEAERANH